MIKAETTELLANFTCGQCKTLNLCEPLKSVEACHVESDAIEIDITAVCRQCGTENVLDETCR